MTNRHKLVALLLLLALLLAVTACGSKDKEEPVEAPVATESVEVQETEAAPPATEVKTEAEPEPTATPVPPTATPEPVEPTPTPEPEPAGEAVSGGAAVGMAMSPDDVLDSYRSRVAMTVIEQPEASAELNIGAMMAAMFDNIVIETEYVREPYARHMVTTHSGEGSLVPDNEMIEIGDRTWMRLQDIWMEMPNIPDASNENPEDAGQFDIQDMMDQMSNDMKEAGSERLDGLRTKKYAINSDITLPMPQPENAEEAAFMPSEISVHVEGTIWIADDKDLPPVLVRSETTQQMSFVIADESTSFTYEEERVVYDINEPIVIEPPGDAVQAPAPPAIPGGEAGSAAAVEGDTEAVEYVDLDALDSYRLEQTTSMGAEGEDLAMKQSLEWVKEPPAWHLTMSMGGMAAAEYVVIGENVWIKAGGMWMPGSEEDVADVLSGLTDPLQPEDVMVLAGEETVNGVNAKHYVYEFSLIHEEVWIASESGLPPVPVKGITTMNMEALSTVNEVNVLDINQPITIEPPQ